MNLYTVSKWSITKTILVLRSSKWRTTKKNTNGNQQQRNNVTQLQGSRAVLVYFSVTLQKALLLQAARYTSTFISWYKYLWAYHSNEQQSNMFTMPGKGRAPGAYLRFCTSHSPPWSARIWQLPSCISICTIDIDINSVTYLSHRYMLWRITL